MESCPGKKNTHVTALILLQLGIMIYSTAGVVSKFASGYDALSLPFLLLCALEIIILGVYAILWQQVIRYMDLSVAYATRSLSYVWTLLWTVLIFKEDLTKNNLLGILLVITGTVLVNLPDAKDAKTTKEGSV